MPNANILENFEIHRVIVHEIFKCEPNLRIPPLLSTEMTGLNVRGMAELQKRVIEAVGHDSHCIQMDITQTDVDSVYSIILPDIEIGVPDNEFIQISHRLVNRLVQHQTSMVIPGGVVLIFDGLTTTGSKHCFGIIKADKLSGFTISNADQHMLMEFLSNLLLTPQQKLYKVAFFVCENHEEQECVTADDVSVFVFDSNNNKSSSDAAAKYFYDSYLGCSFQRNADVLTRDFFNHTKAFISESPLLDGEQKVEAMTALYVYLKVCNEPTISVQTFSQNYLPEPREQDNYSRFMAAKGMPATDFRKDITMVSRKLRQRKIKFSSNVSILAPVDDFSEIITILETDEVSTTVKIRGTIQNEG